MRAARFRYFAWLWRRHPVALVAILAMTLVATAAATSLPLLMRNVFDALAAGGAGSRHATLLYGEVAALELTVLSLLMFTRGTMNDRFQWLARTRAFAALVRQGPDFLARFRTGDLLTRLTDDAGDKLSWFACSGIFRAVAAAATVTFAAAHMIRLDPRLALLAMAPGPIVVAANVLTGELLTRRYLAVQEALSALNDGMDATFSGVRVVKAYGREEAEEQAFARAAERCREAEIAAARTQAVMDGLHGNAWQLAVGLVLWAGGLAVMGGRMTLGTLVAFDNYVLLLVFPMLDLGTFVVSGRRSGTCVDRLLELESAPPAIQDPPGRALVPESASGSLAFEDVHLRVGGKDGRTVLRGVSLSVAPGELVAVAGRLGAGKSMLLRLAPRLRDPDAGRVTLGGRDLRDLPLAAVRGAIGTVFQERALLSGTLRDNVRFWRDGITDEDVAWALRVARLEADVASLPHGLDTTLGVRGVTLSGGQGQRVALARALASKPRVLVLDDVTSALDAETEAALWDELACALPDAATLVVTHRLATLERATRIVVLQDGALVEVGTHATLWHPGSAYHALFTTPDAP